ncbi:membrane protein insertase YidC [Gemella cuniculi]|uniref:membrane protein insertase YidC n=1 Tax=Gemella cuniculi TaxID=150240 RepID=UPI00042447B0|nr:membrane protein insertase YidC [Gemella cuniculi]
MKKFLTLCSITLISFFITGCSAHDTSGFYYNTFTKNMDLLLSFINKNVMNWGISIIIITLLVKGIILPFMLRSYKNQRTSAINMEKAKPELTEIQNKLKKLKEDEKKAINNDAKLQLRLKQADLQKEIFGIYKKYDCKPVSFGNIIPIIIQAPFVTALYFTLQNPIYSKEILNSKFLSISLGEKSFIILILVFIIYMFVGKISRNMTQNSSMNLDTPEAQSMANISKNTVWITPIMLTFMTYTSVAAIGIYFVVSGLLVVFQTLLGKKLYPPYIPKAVSVKPNNKKVKLVKR